MLMLPTVLTCTLRLHTAQAGPTLKESILCYTLLHDHKDMTIGVYAKLLVQANSSNKSSHLGGGGGGGLGGNGRPCNSASHTAC
jgi:hypothetical protein